MAGHLYFSKASKPLVTFWFGCLLILSCKEEKESLVLNQLPTVRISVDSIGLQDTSRLITQSKLNWTGSDPDGYVVGYKIGWSANKATALSNLSTSTLVSTTDSLFNFTYEGGNDTASIYFYISAVDNKGTQSKEPDFLRIPVKNSAPVAQFVAESLPKSDTLWSVLSFQYAISDPDGLANIDSVFIRINNGNWASIPKNLRFISLVPENPEAITETRAVIYSGENLATLNNEPRPLPNIFVEGLVLNDSNRVFLRVKDLAGEDFITRIERPKPYYIKRKTSDLLLIDAYRAIGNTLSDTLYGGILKESGINFDLIDIAGQNGINQPLYWNSTFYLLLKLYNKVFWYSDIYRLGRDVVPLLLTDATPSALQYLRFNGKMLISATFPDKEEALSFDDPVFSLLPIEKIYERSDTLRLRRDRPVLAKKQGYPNLTTINPTSVIGNVDVFYPRQGADTLYYIPNTSILNLPLIGLPIAVQTRNSFNDKVNLTFFAIELTYLSQNRQALKTTLNKILNEDLNW